MSSTTVEPAIINLMRDLKAGKPVDQQIMSKAISLGLVAKNKTVTPAGENLLRPASYLWDDTTRTLAYE